MYTGQNLGIININISIRTGHLPLALLKATSPSFICRLEDICRYPSCGHPCCCRGRCCGCGCKKTFWTVPLSVDEFKHSVTRMAERARPQPVIPPLPLLRVTISGVAAAASVPFVIQPATIIFTPVGLCHHGGEGGVGAPLQHPLHVFCSLARAHPCYNVFTFHSILTSTHSITFLFS